MVLITFAHPGSRSFRAVSESKIYTRSSLSECQFCRDTILTLPPSMISAALSKVLVTGNIFCREVASTDGSPPTVVYYVRSSRYLVQDNSTNILTSKHIARFESLSVGKRSLENLTYRQALKQFTGMYRVDVSGDTVACNGCLAKQRGQICSHELAVMHTRRAKVAETNLPGSKSIVFNLKTLLRDLSTFRRKSGRKPKRLDLLKEFAVKEKVESERIKDVEWMKQEVLSYDSIDGVANGMTGYIIGFRVVPVRLVTVFMVVFNHIDGDLQMFEWEREQAEKGILLYLKNKTKLLSQIEEAYDIEE